MKNSNNGNLLKYIVFIIAVVVGLAAFIPGLIWGLQNQSFYNQANHTQGTITGFYQDSRYGGATHSGGYYAYCPQVQFLLGQQPQRFQDEICRSDVPAYKVGDSVSVAYSPQNPSNAVIDSTFSVWKGPTMLLGIGSVSLIFALILLIMIIYTKRTVSNS